jgi:hypothetical protein
MLSRTVGRAIPFLIFFASLLLGPNAKASLPKRIFTFNDADKITSTIYPNSIPDFQTEKVVGEIKDTKKVTDSPQLRIQKEAAEQSGRTHEIHTGVNTKVSPMQQRVARWCAGRIWGQKSNAY